MKEKAWNLFPGLFVYIKNMKIKVDKHLMYEAMNSSFHLKQPELGDVDNANLSDVVYFPTDDIVVEEIYHKEMFGRFVNVVKEAEMKFLSFEDMKNLFGRRLTPVVNKNSCLIFKFNFKDKEEFIRKLNKTFSDGYESHQCFYDGLFENLQNKLGACWKPYENCLVMFLNSANLKELIIFHEAIHYIQNTTGRGMQKQVSKELTSRLPELFNESEFQAYLNNVCHLFEDKQLDFKQIMDILNRLDEMKDKYETFREFKENAKKLLGYEESAEFDWLLVCFYKKKHISLIKNHIFIYFH